jgi:hypothetical protein
VLGADGSIDVDGHGAADPIAATDLSAQQTPVCDVLLLVYPEGIQLGLALAKAQTSASARLHCSPVRLHLSVGER